MSDPVRLLSTTRDGTARALLDSALSPGPTNAECDAQWSLLARKLPQAVVVGAAAGTAGGALAKVGASKAVSVGIGALVKGAVIVAVLGSAAAVGLTRPWESRGEPAYLAAAASSASSAVPAAAASAVPLAVVEASALPDVPVAASARVGADAPASRSSAARRAQSGAVETAPASAADETALPSESASLLRGRQLLRSGQCEAALAELKAGAARYPHGELAQEREVLSIEALACSGRAPEAGARAEIFVRDYPASPHLRTVRRFTR